MSKVNSVINAKRILLALATLSLSAFYISTTAQMSDKTSSQNELPSTGVAFSLDVTSGEAPLEVNVAVTERPEGEGWSYSWIFNDGTSLEGESVKHTFEKPSEYNIVLIAEREGEVRTATHLVHVAGEAKLRTAQAPFKWDRKAFPEAFEVLGIRGYAYLDSATTVPVEPTESGSNTILIVSDRNDEIVTYDTLIPGIKEYVSFTPEDNIRSEVYNVWFRINVPDSVSAILYPRIDQHPRFAELAARVREEQRFSPLIDGMFETVKEIALDIAREYYKPKVNSGEKVE